MGLDQLDSSTIYAVLTVLLAIVSMFLAASWYSEYLTRRDYEQAFHDEYEDSVSRMSENDKWITQLKYYKQLVESLRTEKPARKPRK